MDDAKNMAVVEIGRFKQIVQAKAKAILYPTEENVRDYLALQSYVAEKAVVFSHVWQKVLLNYP